MFLMVVSGLALWTLLYDYPGCFTKPGIERAQTPPFPVTENLLSDWITKNEHKYDPTKPRKDNLPELATKLCYTASGWVIGGAAREQEPKDYDILIPFAYWHIACQLIPRDAHPNTFGGWKCESGGKIVDVWPADLGILMQDNLCRDLWHPKTGARFKKHI